MKKFILIFVLSVIFLLFVVFFIQSFLLQKTYFENNIHNPDQTIENKSIINEETPSTYNTFSIEAYDFAIANNKILFLYFTSNWCQQCLGQDQLIHSLLKELTREGIVGLSIHILDSETTFETDAFAKKFEVLKEGTIVILDKNGVLSYKNSGDVDRNLLKEKIMEIFNK